jgi:hypothetical protein
VRREGWRPGSFSSTTVRLKQIDPRRFELEDAFIKYTDSAGKEYRVTRDELNVGKTDLASVPTMLWWYVASYGRQTQPALLHDGLVRRSNLKRSDADWVFRDALRANQVPVLRRGLMWAAVSLETTFLARFGGIVRSALIRLGQLAAAIAGLVYWSEGGEWMSWRGLLAAALVGGSVASIKRAGAALLVDHVTLLVGTLCFWLVGERPAWQAAVFGAAVLSWFLWGRRALWMLFGIVALVPAATLVFIVRSVVALLELAADPVANRWRLIAWKLRSGDTSKRPVEEKSQGKFGPTINAPP